MNPFVYQSAAKRYASFRPYFHPIVIEKIKAFLHLQEPVSRGLDVGCGTGQSSLALTSISPTISADDLDFWMRFHPDFCCFRLAIRHYEGYPLGSLESFKGIERITNS